MNGMTHSAVAAAWKDQVSRQCPAPLEETLAWLMYADVRHPAVCEVLLDVCSLPARSRVSVLESALPEYEFCKENRRLLFEQWLLGPFIVCPAPTWRQCTCPLSRAAGRRHFRRASIFHAARSLRGHDPCAACTTDCKKIEQLGRPQRLAAAGPKFKR